MKEEKITYLLGAGASAQALPIVNDIIGTDVVGMMRRFYQVIKDLEGIKDFESDVQSFIDNFTGDLNWVINECKNFATVDTLAKFYYHTDKEKLEKLKRCLAIYFTIDQIIFKKVDKRYLSFITSLLDIKMFPQNVSILNWNYDFQVQLAGATFGDEDYALIGTTHKKTSHFIDYFPHTGPSFFHSSEHLDKYSLVHLNGIAGFYLQEIDSLHVNIFTDRDKNKNEVLRHFIERVDKKHNMLTFAWEKDTTAHQILKERLTVMEKLATGTSILVIIGYSFPFFNRKIDNRIITIMKETALKKIYYQDPFNDGTFLKSQFALPDYIKIESINKVDQFFIPLEL
jgi:hypothetical protein